MHPVRKQRLITVLFILFGSAAVVGIALYALKDNINLFYPPSKIAAGEAAVGTKLKAGGCVVPGSIKRAEQGLEIAFDITDGLATVGVVYTGLLPDLFGEGEAAVVDGALNSAGVIEATKVLAKHDENYVPVEVSDSLNAGGEEEATRDYAEDIKTCKGLKYDS